MTSAIVREVLAEFGLKPPITHAGTFVVPDEIYLDNTWRLEKVAPLPCRLRHGARSGWRIVHRHRPWTRTKTVHTRRGLRRIVREYLAGIDERPGDKPGYITYAKLNHNRFGDFWVWVQRRSHAEA